MQKWVKQIEDILDAHVPHPAIPLAHKDAYTLLVAVLLSAQCTDARVNAITPKLFAKADTPQKMVQLTPEEIEEIIRPCGLGPTKSRAIWALSLQILKEHQGKVPNTFEELEALPGVGHKTASVVMAQAFHKPAFPVDTHIHRCAHRWMLSQGKTVQETENDLKRLFPKTKWIKLHLQIIYFARKYCPARGHHKAQCPICRFIKNK
ncbi:MAG: endonuclease III [Verrucomicrobia bacterium]|nr:endonuclease III [Verrucomicrobiota bacterium]MDE3047375.1 endonuclease III [Verrucomicrobiota bacterium]